VGGGGDEEGDVFAGGAGGRGEDGEGEAGGEEGGGVGLGVKKTESQKSNYWKYRRRFGGCREKPPKYFMTEFIIGCKLATPTMDQKKEGPKGRIDGLLLKNILEVLFSSAPQCCFLHLYRMCKNKMS